MQMLPVFFEIRVFFPFTCPFQGYWAAGWKTAGNESHAPWGPARPLQRSTVCAEAYGPQLVWPFLPSSVSRVRKLAFSIKSVIIRPKILTGYFICFFHHISTCLEIDVRVGSCLCIFTLMFTIPSLSLMVLNNVAVMTSHLNGLNRLHLPTNWSCF